MLIVPQDTFSVAKFWYPNVLQNKKELEENDKNRDGKWEEFANLERFPVYSDCLSEVLFSFKHTLKQQVKNKNKQ